MGYARAGSSPAFGTIYKVYFYNVFGELVLATNSPFFVWCKFGVKFSDFLSVLEASFDFSAAG